MSPLSASGNKVEMALSGNCMGCMMTDRIAFLDPAEHDGETGALQVVSVTQKEMAPV